MSEKNTKQIDDSTRSPFFENFPLWYPKTNPVFRAVADITDEEFSKQYFNWLNRFPLKPVLIWKTYINESEYFINYNLWSYYELVKNNLGIIEPKYNIEQIEIYNGLTDELIFMREFDLHEYNYHESLEKIYADEDMDRLYCKVWFRGFKDYLKVGFPVTSGNPIKTVVPNRKLNYETVEGENWENIENALLNDDSCANYIASSVRKYFSIYLKDLIVPENFDYEKGSLRLVVEYQTNGIQKNYLNSDIL